jgi:hypothetical protein
MPLATWTNPTKFKNPIMHDDEKEAQEFEGKPPPAVE